MRTLLFSMFFWGAVAQGNNLEVPQLVTEVSSKFHETMMVCPDRLWSNYNWENLTVIYVFEGKENSWVWDATTNSIYPVLTKTLPQKLLTSGYAFLEYKGKSSMSLLMDDDGENLFELGAHEFFHYQGQKEWLLKENSTGRGTDYPLSSTPRLYRRMIFDNLKSYFFENNEIYLEQASYWFEKWENEFPEEAASTADGYEGTAEYTDNLAIVISSLGCSASDTEIRNQLKTQYQKETFGWSFRALRFSLSSEGYDMGALAATILRFGNYELDEWNQFVSTGGTPLEYLLKNVSKKRQEIPENLKDEFLQAELSENKKIGEVADDDIKNWDNKDYVRVPMAFQFLQSNYYPQFFAKSLELGTRFMVLAKDHKFVSDLPNGSNYMLKENSVVFDYYSELCPDQGSYILVHKDDLHPAAKSGFEVSTDLVSGKLTGEIKVNENGFDYLCVK